MLDLESAIKHCEEVAEEKEKEAYEIVAWTGDYDNLHYNSCRECASEHRQLAEWLKELKRDRKILNGLSIYFQSLIVDAAINQRPLMFDMRDATKEERESVERYIADSAETTGVNFWNLIGEVNADANSD